MKITKEAAYAVMVRFVREHGRYPSKYDYLTVDYLYSPETSRRLIGNLRDLTILEDLYYENPDRCKNCEVVFPHKHRKGIQFCSQACNKQYFYRKSYAAEKRTKRISICLHCGEEVETYATKYCSLQCQQDHNTSLRILQWLAGETFTNRVIRRMLEVLRGYVCEVCELSEWKGKPITLEVEHKDGNSEDSSMDNVCLICPNCHSQTDTYKGKNRGHGRHSRAQRYRDGKSY